MWKEDVFGSGEGLEGLWKWEVGKKRDGEPVAHKTSRKFLVHQVSSQKLIWTIGPKVRVRMMGMAGIVNPLAVLEDRQLAVFLQWD